MSVHSQRRQPNRLINGIHRCESAPILLPARLLAWAERADRRCDRKRSRQQCGAGAAVRAGAVRVPGSLCRGLLVFSAHVGDREVFLRARGRTFTSFREDDEKEWKGPFFFIQGADPQHFGLMKSWRFGQCDFGGMNGRKRSN
ncbi:unnamed protein product [Ranitomeya imitator]|uniref:Uncharacterized protein n=1 Tax=Ranitomeya imitator TaxID=111125 RepID=A0ABN9LGL0_9NEOB|nr:unnamed protein product [Ranitomeya imitator]